MKKKNSVNLIVSLVSVFMFILWTAALYWFDVKAIGPDNTCVGFATLNAAINNFTGANMTLYSVTDWLGLVPIFVAIGFALLGLIQWIKRKKLRYVDYSLFVLGAFYIVVVLFYLMFEIITVNYRPVLIDGVLEKSYPSSTTLLVVCVMSTAVMQFNVRIYDKMLRKVVSFFISSFIMVFIVFMVVGRLFSGVHWFSDIVGGLLLSVGLIGMYRYAVNFKKNNKE